MDILCNVTVALADCTEISISNIPESVIFNTFHHMLKAWEFTDGH